MTGTAQLARAVALFGQLLLREIDEVMLARLRSDDVAAALEAVGIAVPGPDDLDAPAAEYCAAFLGPGEHVPIIQSVYAGGGHESPSANAVRDLAKAAGLELDRVASRAAAPDHLGAILLLWSELAERWPDGAAHLARQHMAWAREPLAQLAARGDFYGSVAAATASAIEAVLEG